jgi:hypothetical protein
MGTPAQSQGIPSEYQEVLKFLDRKDDFKADHKLQDDRAAQNRFSLAHVEDLAMKRTVPRNGRLGAARGVHAFETTEC